MRLWALRAYSDQFSYPTLNLVLGPFLDDAPSSERKGAKSSSKPGATNEH